MSPALLSVLFLLGQPAPQVLPLWEGKAPHSVGESDADKPKLHAYPAPAEKATGAACVICPGGGYGHLAMDHEGRQVAEFLNTHGIHAYVLQYRIATKERPGPLLSAPLEDAQRAMRMVRSMKGVDARRVGIIGFSAGGHLASTAGTHFDDGRPDAPDAVDRKSCRPDFLVLGYPVITMADGKVTHAGSRRNLLGEKPDAKLIELYSNEKHVTAKTPPTFIFHTHEDKSVVPENTIRFYRALKEANVPAELHLYENGKHGVGMNPKTGTPTDQWGTRLAEWLIAREYGKN